MSDRAFRIAVDTLYAAIKPDGESTVTVSEVSEKLSRFVSVSLHPHQLDGILWMLSRWKSTSSVIVADEMGLGKTLQTLAFMAFLKQAMGQTGPFLVIAPLSVAPQWVKQIRDFVPSLRVLDYVLSQDAREEMRRVVVEEHILKLPQHVLQSGDPQPLPFDVMVSTYETVLSDMDFIDKFKWRVTVYDEGHRLKNSNSVTHKTFLQRLGSPVSRFQIILTGTPVQNNFHEFWSLVHFLHPKIFTAETLPPTSEPPPMPLIHKLVDLIVLRRLFSSIESPLKLPQMKQLLIKTEMTKIQTDLYKWALVQYAHSSQTNPDPTPSRPANILSNLMMTMRKISNHPYLIPGVEPEPFQEGQHIWRNSNKLMILKLLLAKMKGEKSRCLIFSNFTSFLDIVQDYLDFENFKYERLDGSIRGEDRSSAISRFDQSAEADDDVDIFLLSTRAGGVGLNLASANWVIFLDSDWNPQMDLQAIARAHRQGQTKQVSVYRLVSANSIDELMFNRSINKIKLSKSILSESVREEEKINVKEMKNFIAFGVSKLASNDLIVDMPKADRPESDIIELPSIDSLIESLDIAPKVEDTQHDEKDELVILPDDSGRQAFKIFQGIDYNAPLSAAADTADVSAIDELMEKARKLPQPPKPLSVQRDRFAPISEAEREELRRIAQENRKRRKMEKWSHMEYESYSIPIFEPPTDFTTAATENPGSLSHLHGSVVDPQSTNPDRTPIIVHLVDSSGLWPDSGRLFSAIASQFPQVPRQYRRAKEALDLHLGEVHVIPNEDKNKLIALVVCHRNDDSELLKKALYSLTEKYDSSSVDFHFSRIGDKRGNLYVTERIIKRYCCDRGFDAYMYYYQGTKRAVETTAPATTEETSKKLNLYDYFKAVEPKMTTKKPAEQFKGRLRIWLSKEIDEILCKLYGNEMGKFFKGMEIVSGSNVQEAVANKANVFVVTALRGTRGLDDCYDELEKLGIEIDSIETSMPETRNIEEGRYIVITSEQLERMMQKLAKR